MTEPKEDGATGDQPVTTARREALRKLSRFVAVSEPTITLMLAAKTKPAAAAGSGLSSRQFKAGEGAVDTEAMLGTVTSLGASAATIDPIDGIGMCLAAIKGLNDRINGLALQAAAI